MTPSLTFYASGHPRPQGSKRAILAHGKARLVEMARGLKPWRQIVHLEALAALRAARAEPFVGPVAVSLEFVMRRPKRPTKPACDTKPDLDKLVRAVLDGLTGAAIADDSAVVRISASKRYAHVSGIERPGCLVTVAAVVAQNGVEIGERVPE